jgi:hypothetical protein
MVYRPLQANPRNMAATPKNHGLFRLDQPRAPIQGETFNAGVTREKVRVKIGFFNTSTSGSTATHKILADEIDDGNLPGYREATAEDIR